MKSFARRSLSFVAPLLLLFTFALPSQAGLVVTLAPAAGIDLSNVHVGDTLTFFSIGSSDTDPNEHLISFLDVHLFASGTGDGDSLAIATLPGWNGLLGTNPALVSWTFRASVAGTLELYNGFSDCNGLPDDTSGCAVTNLGATRPADSNHLSFTIFDVPEPSSLALVAVAVLALGRSQRKHG